MRIQAKLNHAVNRLQIVQASVGDQTSPQEMVAVGVIAAGYFLAPGEDHDSHELTRTQATTLDELAEKCDTIPTHVKIDVEGSEAAVLRGGRRVLSSPEAPLLFIELHNQIVCERNGDPMETLLQLKSAGYQTFSADGRPIDKPQILNSPLMRIIARKTSS